VVNIRKDNLGKSIREIVFGLEDGLVTTLGLTAGLAASLVANNIVIIAAIVEMFAGAVSMAAGTYLSNKSQLEFIAKEIKKHKKEKKFVEHTFTSPAKAALTISFFYILGAIPPILPYFFASLYNALISSVVIGALTLFGIGVWKTRITKREPMKSGFEMLVVGLLAALVGFIVGNILNYYVGVI